jgi:hypothetical protein
MKQQVWMIIEMKFEAIKAWHLIISFKGSSNFVFSFFFLSNENVFLSRGCFPRRSKIKKNGLPNLMYFYHIPSAFNLALNHFTRMSKRTELTRCLFHTMRFSTQ